MRKKKKGLSKSQIKNRKKTESEKWQNEYKEELKRKSDKELRDFLNTLKSQNQSSSHIYSGRPDTWVILAEEELKKRKEI